MQKFIFLLLIFFSPIIYSEEIKIACQISLETIYENGSSVTKQYNEIFTITDNGKLKSIKPTTSNFERVTTENGLDSSNLSEWNITKGVDNKRTFSNTLTTYKIDRNTGRIWYDNYTIFLKKSWSSKGEGKCEKIDVSKKKF